MHAVELADLLLPHADLLGAHCAKRALGAVALVLAPLGLLASPKEAHGHLVEARATPPPQRGAPREHEHRLGARVAVALVAQHRLQRAAVCVADDGNEVSPAARPRHAAQDVVELAGIARAHPRRLKAQRRVG